jgi:hypothetical protein
LPVARRTGEVWITAVAEYYLDELDAAGFCYEKARDFAEKLRKLAGWSRIDNTLDEWIRQRLEEDAREDYLLFARYLAVCYRKYGLSFESFGSDRLYELIEKLGGGDLIDRLRAQGSGDLPEEIAACRDDEIACLANDAFATIKITIKNEREENYEKALDFLIGVLGEDFPRSYAIEFESPQKNSLPIQGLPDSGVHRLFANAIAYEKLRPKIERYARAAMEEFHWYQDETAESEDGAMPGTYAVFALGICDGETYAPLVADYFELCDNEHSSIQVKFIAAHVEKYGFDERGIDMFIQCVYEIGNFGESELYAERIANEKSLRLFLDQKDKLIMEDGDSSHWSYILITAEINGGFLRDKWRDVAGWGGTWRDGVLQK